MWETKGAGWGLLYLHGSWFVCEIAITIHPVVGGGGQIAVDLQPVQRFELGSDIEWLRCTQFAASDGYLYRV